VHLVARSAKSLLVMALLAGLAADGLTQGRRHRRRPPGSGEGSGDRFEAAGPDPAPSPKPPATPEAESGGP